ncbi:replication-relaxation family protein [Dactylosporangium maewongense]
MTQPHHDPVLYAQSFLTDRDHRLLDWLYDHQVLSTAQITAALFNRQDAAQERLLRLYRLRLLERQCAAPLRFGSVSMHRVRADGHGIYQEGDLRVAFFLELDRATESVPTLVEKVQRYEQLVTEGGPAWPVLFSLPDHTREEHLHKALGRQPRAVPVATVARDRLMDGTGVADAVWLPTGAAGAPEPPRRLIDLGRLGDPADDSALLRLDRRPLAQ